MVRLAELVTEKIGLTRLEGVPEFLDGNKLYFVYYTRGKGGTEEVNYGVIDLSVSRKQYQTLMVADYPRVPQLNVPEVDEELIRYGTWLIWWGSWNQGIYPVKSNYRVGADLHEIDFNTWRRCRDLNQHVLEKGQREWYFPEIANKEAVNYIQQVKAGVKAVAEAKFHPMRQLDSTLSAAVSSIFSFDGDKKQLVSVLKSSWGADLKDGDVKIDLLTKRIIGIESLEDLLPRAGTE